MSGFLDFVRRGQATQKAVDDVLMMHRIRACLNRWAARYAHSPHAKRHVAETNQLIAEIDTWMKNR